MSPNMQPPSSELLREVRAACLDNATRTLADAEYLLLDKRFARGFALTVLAREEMGKLAILTRAARRLDASEPVDWTHVEKRCLHHAAKQHILVALEILIRNGFGGVPPEERPAYISKVLNDSVLRVELNRRKQDAFYVWFADGRVSVPDAAISDYVAWELRDLSVATLEFLDTGEKSDPTTSLQGIRDLYGKYIALADDFVTDPESVRLPR